MSHFSWHGIQKHRAFTYVDPPPVEVKVSDPDTEQRQIIASMFLLTLFVGVPVFIAVRRGRRQPARG